MYISVDDQNLSVLVHDHVKDEKFEFSFQQTTTVGNLIDSRGDMNDYLASVQNKALDDSVLLSELNNKKIDLKRFHVWYSMDEELAGIEYTKRNTTLGEFLQQCQKRGFWAYFDGQPCEFFDTMGHFYTKSLVLKENKIIVQLEEYRMVLLTVQQDYAVLNVVLEYCNKVSIHDTADTYAYFDGKHVALNENMETLKARMKRRDILHLYRYKKPRLPKLPSTASSQQKIKDVDQNSTNLPLYSNWLALKIYNYFWDVNNANKIDDDLAKKFQRLLANCEFNQSTRLSAYDEKTYSALLCYFLNDFLFNDNSDGCCIHQVALANTSEESPDFYVAKVDGSGMPVNPVLLGDYKEDNHEHARTQCVSYTIKILLPGKFRSMLSLPCSSRKISFELHVALDGKLGIIEMCEIEVCEIKQLKCLLYALHTT